MGVLLKYMIILVIGEMPVFNDLSQLINTPSNQDFTGFNKFNKLENLFYTQGIAKKLN